MIIEHIKIMIIKNIVILFLLVCSLFLFDKDKIKAEKINISIDKIMEVNDDNTFTNNLATQPRIVPFVLEDKLIFFKATIQGIKDTLNFVFDTGATACVLDSTVAAKNNIEPFTEHDSYGASGSATYKIASIGEFQVNHLKLNNVTAVLVNLSHLENGRSIDGIIGADFLFDYVTRIDYDKEELIFYNDISEVNTPYKSKLTFDFGIGNGFPIPHIPMRIKLKSGKEIAGKVLMDSGAALNFILNSNITKDNNLLESFNPKITTYSTSLTGEENEYESTLHSLSFNNEKYMDVPISIPLSSEGVISFPGLLGILGNGIMKRYNWIFDYNNFTAYYKPNKLKSVNFKYPCTDFGIKKEGQKMFFENVQNNSVEYKKGIEDGMEVKSVNGYGTEDFTVIKKLLQKESIKLEVEYLTMNGKEKKIIIETNRKI